MVGMRARGLAVAAAGVAAGILLSSCSAPGGGGTDTTEEKPKNVLAGLDPCKILSEQDAQALGATGPGKFVDQGIGERGCDYNAGDFAFTVYKAEDHDKSYYEERKDNFFLYEPNQVGSREGIKQITAGSQGHGLCNQVMLIGDGSAIVQVGYKSGKIPSDDVVCAKALEIAEAVEPKLPK